MNDDLFMRAARALVYSFIAAFIVTVLAGTLGVVLGQAMAFWTAP